MHRHSREDEISYVLEGELTVLRLLECRCRPGPPDFAALEALAGRFGVKFDFSSLPQLVERHGLRLGLAVPRRPGDQ